MQNLRLDSGYRFLNLDEKTFPYYRNGYRPLTLTVEVEIESHVVELLNLSHRFNLASWAQAGGHKRGIAKIPRARTPLN